MEQVAMEQVFAKLMDAMRTTNIRKGIIEKWSDKEKILQLLFDLIKYLIGIF